MFSYSPWIEKPFSFLRILALRKKEREEEQRAREKIRWKLEQDKVLVED